MDIIGFALAVLLIELTPGPNMAWLAGLAATQGRRAGLAAVAGVAVGLLANAMLAALGLAALLGAVPSLGRVLRWAGAAMMIFLAIEAWRGAEPKGSGVIGNGRLRRNFATGAFINLLNPKAYVFFVVVAPRFLDGQSLSLADAALLAVVSSGIATLIHLAIVSTGARAQVWLSDDQRMRMAQRGFALVMLAVAVSFVMADLMPR